VQVTNPRRRINQEAALEVGLKEKAKEFVE
jgi:hypothetical protein